MSFPTPQSGLVIRYSYLWADEQDDGREEGVKDRPRAILLATTTDEGDLRVIVLPITHAPPRSLEDAIEIPVQTKRRLGLDDERSWIVLAEGNVFIWPGPHLRPVPGRGPESIALGYLPAKLFDTVRRRFLELHQRRKARLMRRTE